MSLPGLCFLEQVSVCNMYDILALMPICLNMSFLAQHDKWALSCSQGKSFRVPSAGIRVYHYYWWSAAVTELCQNSNTCRAYGKHRAAGREVLRLKHSHELWNKCFTLNKQHLRKTFWYLLLAMTSVTLQSLMMNYHSQCMSLHILCVPGQVIKETSYWQQLLKCSLTALLDAHFAS